MEGNNEDPTTILPGSDVPSTRPMLEAILERMNALEAKLSGEIASLRGEVEKGFRLIDRRLDNLAAQVSRVQAQADDLDGRVGELERKPS